MTTHQTEKDTVIGKPETMANTTPRKVRNAVSRVECFASPMNHVFYESEGKEPLGGWLALLPQSPHAAMSLLQMTENQLLNIVSYLIHKLLMCTFSIFSIRRGNSSHSLTLVWMIRAEPCLLSGSRVEAILKAWGLQGSERLGNCLFYILTVWVGGSLGNGCPNRGDDGQCYLLMYLLASQVMFWGEGWGCQLGTKLIWQLQQYRHLGY